MEAIVLSRNAKYYNDRDIVKIRVREYYTKFNSRSIR
jgi:hypothetical protein